MFHALVIVVNDGRVDVTLHPDRADAQRAAAKRVLRLMRESSALDIGEDVFSMSEANERGDFGEVVRIFECQARRKVAFIQPVDPPAPAGAAPLRAATPVASPDRAPRL